MQLIELIFYRRHPSLPRGMSENEYLFWYSLPFIVVIIYFIYKFFRGQNRVMRWDNGRIPNELKPTETSIAEVFIVFAGSAAKRGRVSIRAKEGATRKYIKTHFPDAKVLVDESFDHTIWNSIDLNSLTNWAVTNLTPEYKLKLVEFLAWLSYTDDEVLEPERELILYLINRFNISVDKLSEEARKAIEVEQKQTVERPVYSTSRYFRILGLEEGATTEQIKKAFRSLAKKYHPDSNPKATVEQRKMMEIQFREIQEAYDFLMK